MAALTTLCLPLLLVTLLPAGLAYSVFRTGSSRSGDARDIWLSRRSQLGVIGPWELCAVGSCSQEIGLAKAVCFLQCVKDARDAGGARDANDARAQERQLVNPLQLCIKANCPDISSDCIYSKCLAPSKRSPKLKASRVDLKPESQSLEGTQRFGGMELTGVETEGDEDMESMASSSTNFNDVKRAWSDTTGDCIEYYGCSKFKPHTLDYHVCYSTHCGKR